MGPYVNTGLQTKAMYFRIAPVWRVDQFLLGSLRDRRDGIETLFWTLHTLVVFEKLLEYLTRDRCTTVRPRQDGFRPAAQ